MGDATKLDRDRSNRNGDIKRMEFLMIQQYYL